MTRQFPNSIDWQLLKTSVLSISHSFGLDLSRQRLFAGGLYGVFCGTALPLNRSPLLIPQLYYLLACLVKTHPPHQQDALFLAQRGHFQQVFQAQAGSKTVAVDPFWLCHSYRITQVRVRWNTHQLFCIYQSSKQGHACEHHQLAMTQQAAFPSAHTRGIHLPLHILPQFPLVCSAQEFLL